MTGRERLEIAVLLGTGRVGRRSLHVARLAMEALARRPEVSAELFDLDEIDLPALRYRLSDADRPPPGATEFAAKVGRADGLLIVTPEYKGGYPGALKNALDHLDAGVFRRTPIGIATVSAGGFGGLNCLSQLRLVCLAMGGLPIPASFPVSHVREAFDEDGTLRQPDLAPKLDGFLDELIWYARALALARDAVGPAGP
jgi:NAD(P)H-dependent FMN reductase